MVTPRPVDMKPQIMLSCVGPGPADQHPNPHVSAVFRVFVNPKGQKAMQNLGKSTFPVGSVLVKEKFSRGPEVFAPVKLLPDAKPELLTVMIKRPKGFDPANGDWQFAVVKSGHAPETEGLKHCQGCHQRQKKTDYVFGDYGSIRHGGDWSPKDAIRPISPGGSDGSTEGSSRVR